MIDYKKFEGKVVDLTINDDMSGIAEFIEDAGDKIKVRWIIASACYPNQVYSKAVYTETTEYEKECIAEIIECPHVSKDYAEEKRADSIKQDAGIFKRYRKLMHKLQDTSITKQQ